MKYTIDNWRDTLLHSGAMVQQGDEVVFTYERERARQSSTYYVDDTYLSDINGNNGHIFIMLGIGNKRRWLLNATGFEFNNGEFPQIPDSFTNKMQLMTSVVTSLFQACERHLVGGGLAIHPPTPAIVYDITNGKWCVACRKYQKPELRQHTCDGKEVCNHCAVGRIKCSMCKRGYTASDTKYIKEETNTTMCIYCDAHSGDRGVHDYNYKPQAMFFAPDYIERKEFFGWELEVESPVTDTSEIGKAFKDKRWYFKRDGSLEQGVEVVSHPMSFDYMVDNKTDIVKLLKGLEANKCKSADTTTCGMHIHVSKDAVSGLQLWKMLDFFRKNNAFVYTMSGRTSRTQMNRYASIGAITKNTQGKMAKKYWEDANKYTAINIRPRNTIEFRIFKGTLSPSKFYKNLEFVDSLLQWTKDASLDDITIANYCEFVEANKVRYPNVLKFMGDMKMIKRRIVAKSKQFTIQI